MSRRAFFRRIGGTVAVLGAAPLLQACGGGGGDGPPPAGGGTFAHGVASGDPLADRVVLWTRVEPPPGGGTVTVDWVVASDAALLSVVATGRAVAGADRDHTVKIDAAGLRPATTYYYRFAAAGAVSPVGRTRTLPTGATARLRLAAASCASLGHGWFNAYRHIAERADLDLVVHLGDYIYEYGDGDYGNVRSYDPPHETVSLADYRRRHAQYKRDPDLQALHRQHAVVAIRDDHEIADDAWSGGAANHTEGAEGTWTARVAAALRAYDEWMPVRVPDPADPRRNDRSFALGDLAELVMIDERLLGRSEQLDGNTLLGGIDAFRQTGAYTDPSRQMLDPVQRDWLATTLRGTGARWKLLAQGVMFAQLKLVGDTNASGGGIFINPDQWDGYQPARDRVHAILAGGGGAPRIDDVVVLTGDIHTSWAADLTPDPNNPDVSAGGYDPASGAGSRAVEFVAPSVTSPGLPVLDTLVAAQLQRVNPHFRYIDLTRRGYMLLDIDAARVTCEWWYVDGVRSSASGESFGAAWQVRAGSNRLIAGERTASRTAAPALAP